MKTMIEPHRRKEIKSIVIAVLEHYGKYYLPVDIKKICKSYDFIRVIPFSVQMKHRNMSLDEVITYCETDDACADYYYDRNKAIIYYNDVTKWKFINSNRYRWSIAHELGHIMLGHHAATNKTRIFRSSLSDIEYDYFEEEADYFAQLILVPHSALWGFNIQNANHIKILCKISGPASRKRMYEYNAWKHNGQPMDDYDNRILTYYYSYVYKRKCKTCGTSIIQRHGKYCPICGSKNTLQWGDGDKMKYKNYEIDDNGRLKQCIICENENIIGGFCHICGSPAQNFCTGYINNFDMPLQCQNDKPLLPNARYCPTCGEETIFKKRNILIDWKKELQQFEEQKKDQISQDGFLNIPDGIEDALDHIDSNDNFSLFSFNIDEELPFR